MKEFIAKIFRLLGLADPDESLSPDEAIKMIVARMDEIARDREMGAPAAGGLVRVVGLPRGATWRELLVPVQALKRQQELHAFGVEELIDKGVAQNHIHPDQADFVRAVVAEHGFACAEAYVKHCRCWPLIEAEAAKLNTHAGIDELQKSMNRRLGVGEAIFLKYNPANGAGTGDK